MLCFKTTDFELSWLAISRLSARRCRDTGWFIKYLNEVLNTFTCFIILMKWTFGHLAGFSKNWVVVIKIRVEVSWLCIWFQIARIVTIYFWNLEVRFDYVTFWGWLGWGRNEMGWICSLLNLICACISRALVFLGVIKWGIGCLVRLNVVSGTGIMGIHIIINHINKRMAKWTYEI